MQVLNRWQVGSAWMVVVGIAAGAIAPFTLSSAAVANPVSYNVAQLFPSAQPSSVVIPAGARIPVQYLGTDNFVVAPTESRPLSLAVAKNIRSPNGALLIPAGSEVQGQLVPVNGGAQFVGGTLVLPNGSRVAMNANSELITTKNVQGNGVNSSSILKGAGIGAGGATVVSAIAGRRRVTVPKILLGAGLGAAGGLLLGQKPTSDAIALKPNTNLTLTLNSRLALESGYSNYPQSGYPRY
jgi:hypothetical protein